jgi:hypothetical protein
VENRRYKNNKQLTNTGYLDASFYISKIIEFHRKKERD